MWYRLRFGLLAACLIFLAGCSMATFLHEKAVQRTETQSDPEWVEQFNTAERLIDQLQYSDAEVILLDLAYKFRLAKDVQYASKAFFWLGFCAEKLARHEEAIDRYQRVLTMYPGTIAAVQAFHRKQNLINMESK